MRNKSLAFILLLSMATAAKAYMIQSISQEGPYDLAPSGAMDNASSGLETEPQPGVSDIQPLIPKQPDQNQDKVEINSNPISVPPASHVP